jgi:hypothetical protein
MYNNLKMYANIVHQEDVHTVTVIPGNGSTGIFNRSPKIPNKRAHARLFPEGDCVLRYRGAYLQ